MMVSSIKYISNEKVIGFAKSQKNISKIQKKFGKRWKKSFNASSILK